MYSKEFVKAKLKAYSDIFLLLEKEELNIDEIRKLYKLKKKKLCFVMRNEFDENVYNLCCDKINKEINKLCDEYVKYILFKTNEDISKEMIKDIIIKDRVLCG